MRPSGTFQLLYQWRLHSTPIPFDFFLIWDWSESPSCSVEGLCLFFVLIGVFKTWSICNWSPQDLQGLKGHFPSYVTRLPYFATVYWEVQGVVRERILRIRAASGSQAHSGRQLFEWIRKFLAFFRRAEASLSRPARGYLHSPEMKQEELQQQKKAKSIGLVLFGFSRCMAVIKVPFAHPVYI